MEKTLWSCRKGETFVVVLFVLCFRVDFVPFEPYVRFHTFSSVRVSEWPLLFSLFLIVSRRGRDFMICSFPWGGLRGDGAIDDKTCSEI